MDYDLKDSGKREEFTTGSKRDTQEGKTRPDLIPHELIRRLGDLLGKGASKYGERNWEKGQPLSRVMASLKRHLLQIEEGDTSEDHMAAVVFGIMVFMHHLPRIADGRLPAHLADTEWSDAWLATFAPEGYDSDDSWLTVSENAVISPEAAAAYAKEDAEDQAFLESLLPKPDWRTFFGDNPSTADNNTLAVDDAIFVDSIRFAMIKLTEGLFDKKGWLKRIEQAGGAPYSCDGTHTTITFEGKSVTLPVASFGVVSRFHWNCMFNGCRRIQMALTEWANS